MADENLSMRAVPYSEEAEQSVLGAMILDKTCIPDVLEIVKGECFYAERNRELFEALVELYNTGKPIDVVTVKEQLTQRGTFDKVGGLSFVVEVSNAVPSTGGVREYAKIVEEKSLLRRLIKTFSDVNERCYGGEDVQSIIALAQQNLIDINQGRTENGLKHIGIYLNESLDEMDRLSKQDEAITGIPTGFKDIDRRTAGFHPAEFILIASRPGMGKSSLALNIMQNAAIKSGKKVAIFSLEMPGIQVANRMLSGEARISSDKIKRGNLKDEDWGKIGSAVARLSGAGIYIDDTSSLTVTDVAARCRKQKMETGLDMVLIDYLQLMNGSSSSGGNRQQEISEISRTLKILANDLEIPVIALSQLSRAVEKRESKEPMLSDLRESGAIEQDADIVMFLYREGYYDEDAEEPNRTKVKFDKHRNGEVGSEYLTWLGEFTKFSDWSGEREN